MLTKVIDKLKKQDGHYYIMIMLSLAFITVITYTIDSYFIGEVYEFMTLTVVLIITMMLYASIYILISLAMYFKEFTK